MAEAEGQKEEAKRGLPKLKLGTVVSNKMDKTVVVAIARQVKHQAYGKYIQRTRRYQAHDEKNECSVGDIVEIINSKPISKNKHWRVARLVTKAVQV